MRTVEEYLNLITSEHRDKPNFIAMVDFGAKVPVKVQNVLEGTLGDFDVDTAIGAQLDIVGLWVGISRNVQVPIENVYFSWDSVDFSQGWEFGVWQPNNQPTALTVLPDDVYRTLIKAKIAANQWDGTTEGAYAIWDRIFTTYRILIQDHQNMSYDLAVVGGIVDSLTLALLVGGYIPLKPEGVRVNEYLVPVNDGPLFGWDIDSAYVTGWEDGSWAREFTV